MLQRIYTYFKDKKHLLWAGAVAAAVVIVILLAVLLPQPGPEGPGATPTPSATATPAGNTTATATAGGTASPGGTATAGGTATSGRTSTPRPTRTPRPTAGGGAEGVEIFFTEGSYSPAPNCQNFHTTINITAPVDYFGACQYRLMWDPALFRIMDAWTVSNGYGRAYDGANWTRSDQQGANPTGDNPFGLSPCPQERPNMGDGRQGCANFVTGWIDQMSGGNGMNIAVPPEGPAEATLITIRWQTSGPACWGKTANTGTTELEFIPTLMCACSKAGVAYEMEDVYTLNWFNTSVTVK